MVPPDDDEDESTSSGDEPEQGDEESEEEDRDEEGEETSEEEDDSEEDEDSDEEGDEDEEAEAEGGDEEDGDEDLPELDEDVFGSRDQWENASDEDFEDDEGGWTADDYEISATALFGDREDFGQTANDQYLKDGFAPSQHAAAWGKYLDETIGGGGSSVRFYEKDGQLVPRGFLSTAALEALALLVPDLDLSRLHVTVPKHPLETGGEGQEPPAPPRPLPSAFQNISPADSVDLRKYCSPVGDQGQTSRCAAFAWTHAIEMLGNIQGKALPRLACSRGCSSACRAMPS